MSSLPSWCSRSSAWKYALVVGLASIGAYFALPGAAVKDVGYSTIGIASVACVLVAVRLHRPEDRRCWQLIAAGNLCFVLGDGVYDVYEFILHRAVPFPSVADALYLAGYPLIMLGLVRLTRLRGHRTARESYADAAIVSIGALALSWHFLVGSYASDSTMDNFAKLVTVAYPMMDIAVLFVVLRGLAFGTARLPVHRLLAGSLLSMLIGDFIYDLLVQHASYGTGNPVDAGWLLGYVLLGTAALHPSIARGDGGASRTTGVERRRLPLVAVAGFIAPTILLISGWTGTAADIPVLAGLSVALFSLVMVRMSWLFSRLSAQAHALETSLAERDALAIDLRYQAFHDALTGLANRALLHDRIEHALASSARSAGAVALCLCDLDGFKTVNDSLGHAVGDDVLKAVAQRLTALVRAGDTVSRLGGDEFAVLMENVGHPDVASAVAQRMVSALRQPFELNGRQIEVSASVGVTVADGGMTTELLLSEADSAMYIAKLAGKNRFEIFRQSMRDQFIERIALKNGFSDALLRSEFFLHYQPQFSLRDGSLEGFEALVRWNHPTLGLLSPDRFIRLAEETGHIVPIGRWVLETAFEWASSWSSESRTPLTIAVNISGRQLQNPQIVEDVVTALAISGLDPRQVTLEITENVLLLDVEGTAETGSRLRAIGLRLAIDDFGTGYSSLSHLRHFPIDLLKIDKSFIAPLARGSRDEVRFVKTIIDLAHSLGLRTLAEGVERYEQRDILIELGCDSAQGYLMAPPLDPVAARTFVGAPIGPR